MSSLHYVNRPELRQPSMVVAFQWLAGCGEASSIAMRALVSALDAEKVAEIDCDPFYVFTEARPVTSQPEPGERVLIWPTSEFYTWRDPDEERDLVLLQAREPNIRWREYVELILQVAQDFSVTRMIGLGSNYDAVSHRRPVKLSGRGTTPEISEALSSIGVKETSYQGPSSIQSAILDACRLRGLPAGNHVRSRAALRAVAAQCAGELQHAAQARSATGHSLRAGRSQSRGNGAPESDRGGGVRERRAGNLPAAARVNKCRDRVCGSCR